MKYPSGDMKSKSLVTILLFLILSFALVATERIPVRAQATTEISVINPLTGDSNFVFYTNLTSAGDRFNVTVWISEGTDVVSWQVYMTYNTTLLNATGGWVPSTDPEYIFYGLGTFTPPPFFDPEGAVLVGDVTLPSVGVDFATPKLLAIFEFEVLVEPPKGEGNKVSGKLAIDNVDTFILDFDENRIPANRINGLYEFNWVAIFSQLEVKPREYITQKLETFSIEIWLNKVGAGQRLVSVQFWLHYNATLLNVTKVEEGSFLAQFKNAQTEPYTFFISEIENQTVKVGIVILPNATLEGGKYNVFPQGNGTLAIITFRGLYQGQYPEENNCTLELTNIILLDDNVEDIETLPRINGFYKILPRSPSTISLVVDPTTIEFGSSATLSGVITPIKEDVNVTIYNQLETGEWTQLAIVKTNTTGEYTYNWTPERIGTFEFKANWTGDETTLSAESSVVELTVNKATSEISLNVDPQTVELGSNVTISGSITPKRIGANVTISYKLTGGTWSELATVETDSNSQYTYTWKTSQPGTYEINASWSGDENTLPAESDAKTINVEAPANVFLYILVAVIATIAVVLILYYVKIKKSKQTRNEKVFS